MTRLICFRLKFVIFHSRKYWQYVDKMRHCFNCCITSVSDERCEYHNFFPTKREIIFDEAVDAQLLGKIIFSSIGCYAYYPNMHMQAVKMIILDEKRRYFFLFCAKHRLWFNLCLRAKIKKNIVYPCRPHFYDIKVRRKGVYITWKCYHDEVKRTH